jgi:hypothetical protein
LTMDYERGAPMPLITCETATLGVRWQRMFRDGWSALRSEPLVFPRTPANEVLILKEEK